METQQVKLVYFSPSGMSTWMHTERGELGKLSKLHE